MMNIFRIPRDEQKDSKVRITGTKISLDLNDFKNPSEITEAIQKEVARLELVKAAGELASSVNNSLLSAEYVLKCDGPKDEAVEHLEAALQLLTEAIKDLKDC